MRGLGGSGTGLVAASTTTTTTTKTTWERCCRCRVAVATAALRRWRPKVFGYAMLVSLLAAHLLPPVWAATRPTPDSPPSSPLSGVPAPPPPPRDDGGGGGGGGRAAEGGRIGRDIGASRTDKSARASVPRHPPGGQPLLRTNRRSPLSSRGQCHGWGIQLQRLLLRRSSGSHPHRQYPSSSSSSSSSSHRHSQHHPPPNNNNNPPALTSFSSYSLSPAPLSKSSTSSHDDVYINNNIINNNNNPRGLPPQAPLQVVIQQRDLHAPSHPHPHPAQQPPQQEALYHHQLQEHLYLQLNSHASHTQRRDIQQPAHDDDGEDDDDEGNEDEESRQLCTETETQQKELPELCDCSTCAPFNHSDPTNPESDRCRRSTLTHWMMCQSCSCGTRQRRLHALLSTQLPFCSQFSLAYLLPCAFLRSSGLEASGHGDRDHHHHERWCDEDCGGGGGGGSREGGEGSPSSEGCLCTKKDCVHSLNRLLSLDETAEERFEKFKGLLDRYDCNSRYSVKWGCDQCEEAYKHWLCASTLTFYLEGRAVRPCSTFCQQVEAMCPFFRPKVDTHEGDPSFICKDPEMEGDPVHYHSQTVSGAHPLERVDIQDLPCFQLCHVMSPGAIRRTFCPGNSSRCSDLRRELFDCPPLRLLPDATANGLPAGTDSAAAAPAAANATANATSSASASVHRFSGDVTRTTLLLCWAVVVMVVGVGDGGGGGGGGGGGRDRLLCGGGVAVVWLRWVALVSLLWMVLTLYPYWCIGLT